MTSLDMFPELYQIASYIVFKVISGILGELAEFRVLRAINSRIQGIPAFRDFTIRDPRYFVIFF